MWEPFENHPVVMWEPCGYMWVHVGRRMWEPCGKHEETMWEPRGKHVGGVDHVGNVREPSGNKVGTVLETCGIHVGAIGTFFLLRMRHSPVYIAGGG